MKIFALYPLTSGTHDARSVYTGSEDMAVCMLGDVSSVPDHHPFFIPDFASRFEATPALCVRLGRVGKSIAPRFASRYIAALAPALLIIAADRLAELRMEGLPWTEAVAFDGSAPAGKWSDGNIDTLSQNVYEFHVHSTLEGNTGTQVDPNILTVPAAEFMPLIIDSISFLSRTVTLKTGDLIYIALRPEGIPLKQGLRISALTDSSPTLSVRIR